MSLTIKTSTSSLIAQSSLKTSTSKLNQAIERMSSGAKINHAKDNAANYSIATNMTTKINAYMVAEDNCAMGLDMITTANDTLDSIYTNLSRIRELATLAKNNTNSSFSLNAYNIEVNQLVDEIMRLYKDTEYNGIKLFGKINQPKFITEPEETDIATLTKLSEVDSTQVLAKGTYSISTAEELAKLAQMNNNGLLEAKSTFVLSNDIDLFGYKGFWESIGNSSNPFQGTFNGNGYKISNLYIDANTDDYVGLFGNVSSGTICNLGLENAEVSGNKYVGIIAGKFYYSKINNCYACGAVNGTQTTGGLVGDLDHSEVNDSYSTADIVVSTTHAGGITGSCYHSSVIDSFATGNITATQFAGGLVGRLSDGGAVIKNSFATGDVTATKYVGGLVGYMSNSKIFDSYAEGNVYGISLFGGLAGSATNVIITNCYSTGSVDDNVLISSPSNLTIDDISSVLPENSMRPFEYDYLPELLKTLNDIVFQVGNNSTINSQIIMNTSFSIDYLDELRDIGQYELEYFNQIDSLLEKVSVKQTEYGAVQNRLESALNEISTQYDNLVSSRSTIQDADIADVSAEYIKMQILQQASATLMATANQSPAIALQLL